MAKYLFEASYATQGVKGIRDAGGTSRRDVVTAMIEGLGGEIEPF